MESVIDHCCYTFMREVLVWKKKVNGKTQYVTSDEVTNEIKNVDTGVLMILYPQFPGVKSAKTGFHHGDKLDLILTEDDFQAYCKMKTNPWANIPAFLNVIMLKKLESLEPLEINPFMTIQMDLYLQRGGKSIAFFTYTKNLLESQNQPWTAKYNLWLECGDPEKERDANARRNQLSARQLAIAIHMMEETQRVNLRSVTKREKAKFLEFLSGISFENIEDKMSRLGDYTFSDLKTQCERTFLRQDFEKVGQKFQELGFIPEIKAVDKALDTINSIQFAKHIPFNP